MALEDLQAVFNGKPPMTRRQSLAARFGFIVKAQDDVDNYELCERCGRQVRLGVPHRVRSFGFPNPWCEE